MVVLDTSIIIDHLRKPSSSSSYLLELVSNNPHINLFISLISIQELYTGKSSANLNAESFMLSILSTLNILAYDYEVAQLAGKISRDISNRIKYADAAIAATCIYHGYKLATLNIKDFSIVPGLELFELKKP